jgi:hypothetical protein
MLTNKKTQLHVNQIVEFLNSGDAENTLRFFSSLPLRKCPGTDLSEQRS